jgi:outer membrane immunogenic protein
MKKLFLASIAMVALSAGGSALAADMPVKARPAPPPVYSWSGCYGGGFVGYGWGESQHRSADPRVPRILVVEAAPLAAPAPPPPLNTLNELRTLPGFDPVGRAGLDITPSFDMSGALGGFDVGCQYQFGWWLIGVEVDAAATNKDGQAFDLDPFFNPFFVSQTTERWMATARLRLGYAADKWLFFITGGGAWSGVEATVWNSVNPAISAHHKRTLAGWTVGAGWEYALGYGWSWKSEFLYIDYGLQRFFDPADTCSPNCAFFVNPRDVSLKNYVFRTGLNWRFDWGKAPVAVMAKY